MMLRARLPVSFQFTPLREGRLPYMGDMPVKKLFQFTPLREGRRHRCGRATDSHISIHAPPRGATRTRCPKLSARRYFNSRPSARGDISYPAISQLYSISIHAPPRGATHVADAILNGIDFNSRPSARGDSSLSAHITNCNLFQFTPLREGRRQKICNFCKSFVQPLQISMA